MNYIESKSDIDIDWPLVRENIIQNQVVLHDMCPEMFSLHRHTNVDPNC